MLVGIGQCISCFSPCLQITSFLQMFITMIHWSGTRLLGFCYSINAGTSLELHSPCCPSWWRSYSFGFVELDPSCSPAVHHWIDVGSDQFKALDLWTYEVTELVNPMVFLLSCLQGQLNNNPHYQSQLYLVAQDRCRASSPECCRQWKTWPLPLVS